MSQVARKPGRICLALALVVALCWAAVPRPSLAQDDCSTTTDNTPCFGPKSGSLTMDPTSIASLSANVAVTDFIATVTFTNPYATSKGSWDYGFFFRSTDQEYRLIIRSTREWKFHYGVSDTDIASGTIPTGILDTSPTGKNSVVLIVSGNDGLFFLNNTFIGYLDVSEHTDAGDVLVVTSVIDTDFVKGGVTKYTNFSVWPSPLGGAGSGGAGSGGV